MSQGVQNIMAPVEEALDHVRGGSTGRLIVEDGDYECPYSRRAFRLAVLERVRRDVHSGVATGQVHGTPTLFIDGVVHRGSYDAGTLLDALAR
jgi:protein-disulfide isomerase